MSLTVETWPVDKIIPYDKNAKLHHVEWIAQSISEFSIDQPIVVDGQGVIIKGHGRLKAAKQLGLTEFPVVVRTDLTPEQIRLARIADNRSAEGGWDSALLGEELNALLSSMPDYDFDALGLSDDWFSSLDVPLDTAPAYDDAALDNVPELNEEEGPITKPGDLWQLGKHRLLCGDSTSETDVARLMDGEKVDMVFTDPPYNVAFNGRSGKFEVILNDDQSDIDFELFIDNVCQKIKYLSPELYYVWCNWKFYGILQEKLPYKSCIVWAKNNFGLGHGYRHQHEFCLFNGSIDEYIKNESDLWQISKEINYVHPTQKPVELCLRALGNHKNVRICLDLFGGSGSTLIACEKLNRQCLMMELDPRYCDVIVKRWETLTGNHAVLL